MSAKASGADAANGGARNREHNQGNQDRKYTVEQKAAVIRVRRCQPTAFYDILGLEEVKTSCNEAEIKKAYRKLSLLTHPDKNGHEHADEAFKMVSRAFGVLSDADKKSKYDRFGGDPDSRFGGASAPSANPFSGGGFSGRQPSGGQRGFDEDISAEEMFNRFFGGGGMGGGFGGPFGGGGMFDSGPQFVFNLGGGPGIRVQQFGGWKAKKKTTGRRRAATKLENDNHQLIAASSIINHSATQLVVLWFIIWFTIRSLQPGNPPYTSKRMTTKLKVDYYINPADIIDYTPRQLSQLDQRAEVAYVQDLRIKCETEIQNRQRAYDAAQGWFFADKEAEDAAKNMALPTCTLIDKLRVGRGSY